MTDASIDVLAKAKMIVNATPVPSSRVNQTSGNAVTYASFWRRWAAAILDGMVLSVPMAVLQGVFGGMIIGAMPMASLGVQAIGTPGNVGAIYPVIGIIIMWMVIIFLLNVCYYVIGVAVWGKTIGKKIMKIKVVREDNSEFPGYGKAFMRETIGKWLSSMIFNLGFLWVIWDPKKQSWHDKIVGTVVIKDTV